jgi:chromosome segregation ATPase
MTGPKITAAALAARRQYTENALDRVRVAITLLRREKAPITMAAVARRARVSRTFLYTNPDAKNAVVAIAGDDNDRTRQVDDNDDRFAAGWRERALNAEDALKRALTEILGQRTRIGELLGRIRDLEAEWTEDAIQRITTENTTLKRRVRQLTADNRTLDDRLAAARSNLRFQDRRIADLETQLAHPERIASMTATVADDQVHQNSIHPT